MISRYKGVLASQQSLSKTNIVSEPNITLCIMSDMLHSGRHLRSCNAQCFGDILLQGPHYTFGCSHGHKHNSKHKHLTDNINHFSMMEFLISCRDNTACGKSSKDETIFWFNKPTGTSKRGTLSTYNYDLLSQGFFPHVSEWLGKIMQKHVTVVYVSLCCLCVAFHQQVIFNSQDFRMSDAQELNIYI